MLTHHSVMTSSLRIKILKIDKFGDFSCDIDYNIRTYVFRDIISLIINQCDSGAQRAPPADTKCPAAQASKLRLCFIRRDTYHVSKLVYIVPRVVIDVPYAQIELHRPWLYQ